MRHVLRGLLVAMVLAGVALTQAGCLLVAAAGATAGAVAYVKGDLEGVVDASVEQTVAATKAAFEEMKMPVMSAYSAGPQGEVQARVGTDNKAVVELRSYGEKSTKVTIRVGTFGDETLSRTIYEKIKANVTAPKAAAALVG